jgi:hypothetical protein
VQVKRLIAIFLLAFSACSGSGKVGDACSSGKDCASNVCVHDVFPGGICTEDCTNTLCHNGTCGAYGGYQVCLPDCTTSADCRAGYQCFFTTCRPNCSTDDECGQGYVCMNGACVTKPGSPVGADCNVNEDCSSSLCGYDKKCVQGCDRDAQCPMGQTCYINPVGTIKPLPTTQIIPICIARRATGMLGSACTADKDCDQGSCQLGICSEMCETSSDCHAGTECVTNVALVDDRSGPTFKGCLPQKGTLDFDGARGNIPLPSNGQAFTIYTHVEPFDFNLAVGVTELTDPTAMNIYTQPANEMDFYNLPVRYLPTEGSSTMLVPNSPRVTLTAGLYKFQFASSGAPTPTARVYIKLGDAPPMTGTAPLNIYYTDLTGACQAMTFNQLKQGGLSTTFNRLATIYSQAGITFSSTNFVDVSASVANSIRVATAANADMLPDLDMLLQTATAQGGLTAGLDVVLVRTITDPNGNQSGVLGIAGGIPTNPALGTAHSGVAVSMETLCFGGTPVFASTIAHELGHSIGLFHNIEMDSTLHDPLTDTMADGKNNLMYWLEDSGEHISAQQGQVMRNDAKVKQ